MPRLPEKPRNYSLSARMTPRYRPLPELPPPDPAILPQASPPPRGWRPPRAATAGVLARWQSEDEERRRSGVWGPLTGDMIDDGTTE